MTPNSRPGLEHLRIVSPCPKQWEDMEGNDTKRFCGDCQKHVHNLSAMTRKEIDILEKAASCHMCVHYVPDDQGNPITLSDRPATYRVRWGLARALAIAAGVAVVLCMPATSQASWSSRLKSLTNSGLLAQKGRAVKVVDKACEKLQKPAQPTLRGEPTAIPIAGKRIAPPALSGARVATPQTPPPGLTGGPAPAPPVLGRPSAPPKRGNSNQG